MTTADRRFEIIVVLYHRSDYVKVSTLSDMFAAVDSTIRSDMDYLREHFSIESRSGKDGGYRLIDAPIFFIHAEMLHNVKKTIERMGGIEGYNSDLMEQTIQALNSIKKRGSYYSL